MRCNSIQQNQENGKGLAVSLHGDKMSRIIVGLIAAVVIFLLFRIIASKINKPNEPVTYVCDECGEKDCVCRKEDEALK
jgi:hypothetical protein